MKKQSAFACKDRKKMQKNGSFGLCKNIPDHDGGRWVIEKTTLNQAFFWTFAQKLKVKRTKSQAQITQNSRIFRQKLKKSAIF